MAPMGICVSKVPLPRLRHDSWAQMREKRFARDGPPVGLKTVLFGFWRSYPAGEVEKWFLPPTTSCGVPLSLDPLGKRW